MIINNRFFDQQKNEITLGTEPNGRKFNVVYAHVGDVNANGLKLNADSIKTTRDRYPLLFEHSDKRVEDVVGFIETDGKPNEVGEFIGVISFYNTPQGQHAEQLWLDKVIDELSVSYFMEDYDIIEPSNGERYIEVKSAILKEVSLVSVGADRKTGEKTLDNEFSKSKFSENSETSENTSDDVEILEPSENSDTSETSENEPEKNDFSDKTENSLENTEFSENLEKENLDTENLNNKRIEILKRLILDK